MSQAYAFPPDTQIDDPCEGGRCHKDKESGAFLACRKHEAELDEQAELDLENTRLDLEMAEIAREVAR